MNLFAEWAIRADDYLMEGSIVMASIINTNTLIQVGFVVKDIEVTRRKFAQFFGVEPPKIIDAGRYEVTGTTYMGQPAPDANCLMAFFQVGANINIELIQPNGAPSTWQDYLDQHGEGMHHIAFQIRGMDDQIKACEAMGMKLTQRGKYGSGDGEYAYMDATADLKCFLELLEDF